MTASTVKNVMDRLRNGNQRRRLPLSSTTKTTAVVKFKPEKKKKERKQIIKKSGLNGVQTHDLCDTDAVLFYQLSYQANWEVVKLSVCNSSVEGE